MGEHIRLGRVATATRSIRRWWVPKVEFDPLDLTRIEVRLAGAPMGLTALHRIGRHSHPKAKPETPTAPSKPCHEWAAVRPTFPRVGGWRGDATNWQLTVPNTVDELLREAEIAERLRGSIPSPIVTVTNCALRHW